MQFCCHWGHLEWMRIADDSSYIFLAGKLAPDKAECAKTTQSFNSLHLSCVLSKFSSDKYVS